MKRLKALLFIGAMTCAAIGCNDAGDDAGANDNGTRTEETNPLNESEPDAGKDVNVPDNTAVIDTTGDAQPDANTTYTTLKSDNDNNNRNDRDTIGDNRRNP